MKITDQNLRQEYYNALINKDRSYLDKFIVGVNTAGIYCISSCTARKPKFENVDFFSTIQDGLRFGYRPCKVCKPTQNKSSAPKEVLDALSLLKKSEENKISDYELRQNSINPEKVRRWFKSNHGITFQAYQRMLRINKAFEEIRKGKSVTDSAFTNGFDSLSGFGYTFKKQIGLTPKEVKEKNMIFMQRFQTPLGPMFACASDEGICLLEFTDRRMLETEFTDLQHRLKAIIIYGTNEHLKELKKQLKEYFEGERKNFDVSLHTPTTPFRQSVWDVLQEIPFGTTTTYMKQAHKMGNTKAVRAVASANGHNRVAIVIPCHRVIGSDGHLTGYAGGLDRKAWLLEHEGAIPKDKQGVLF